MKIIIFDDDPTGSQTVHSCPLLLRWDQQTLTNGINDPSPLLFLLANTRSLLPELAAKRIREMSKSIREALISEGVFLKDILFVSRGDSTLRGHGVLEPKIINEQLGPFDATFHVPAFFEGGRTTLNGVHLLNGSPVHTTPFAKDKTFGYSTSHLDLWLEEKSQGFIQANDVKRLSISMLDAAVDSKMGMTRLIDWLLELTDNQFVVVDAQAHAQLAALGKAVRNLIGKKRFLFRSAASLINGLANLPPQPFCREQLSSLRLRNKSGRFKTGLVTVGSHVPLADQQLEVLLGQSSCEGIELEVKKIEGLFASKSPQQKLLMLQEELFPKFKDLLVSGKTPVLFSSRGELQFSTTMERIKFGNFLAEVMANLVGTISSELGYVISKGGITSHALMEIGLKLDLVHLKGQLMPGLSVVSSADNSLEEGLPIVTFPGNLGEKDSLLNAWKLMENKF